MAVALELDPDHPAVLREPRQHGAEAAFEGEDSAMEGDERRPVGVAVLLVPHGNAIDFLVRHIPTMSEFPDRLGRRTATSPTRTRPRPGYHLSPDMRACRCSHAARPARTSSSPVRIVGNHR